MKKIVIIGAGFAGLSLACRLSRYRVDYSLILIDKRKKSCFLPLLPDVISGYLPPEHLEYDIAAISKLQEIDYLNEEVVRIDTKENVIFTANSSVQYDFLVIASGSETNFFDNQQMEENAFKLDCVQDAISIVNAVKSNNYGCVIIVGAGYTGIELATSLRKLLTKNKLDIRLLIVERERQILSGLEDWMRSYVLNNLVVMNIEVLTSCVIKEFKTKDVLLSDNNLISNCMVIQTAGKKTPDFLDNIDFNKDNLGRIKVDRYLRASENCFVIGDCANFSYQEKALRMAVQFSLSEADIAARNIINTIYGIKLYPYKPKDLGFIVPMANWNSCGKVLSFNTQGKLASLLHYAMCVYRTIGLRNKFNLIRSLVYNG